MKCKKVIFLDVDGVLNDGATDRSVSHSPCGDTGLCHEMIENLAEIVRETGAKIVLVSQWKDEWDVNPEFRTEEGVYLDHMLKAHGLKISDKTTDRTADRGHGIVSWLSDHPDVRNWVVLDDDVSYDYEECGIFPHLVRTHYCYGGLTERMADQAIEILSHTMEE